MNDPYAGDRIILAVLSVLTAYLLFTCLDTVAKYLVTNGLPSLQVSFVRYLGHFVMALLVYLPLLGRRVFHTNMPRIQVFRALSLLGATLFNFTAVAYLPLTVTIPILFAAPFGVCLLSIKVLGEHVGARRLSAVFVGFLGVVVMTQFWNANFQPAMGLSIGAFICTTFYLVLTRKIATTDSNAVSQIYASGIATFALAPVGFYFWVAPSSFLQWGLLGLTGILGFVGHSLITIGHRYAQASTLAPLVYMQIIYVTIISWLVFNDLPDRWTLAGTAIIIASGLYIWLRERKLRSA